jgi:arylsulfatase A-like enzyme
MKNIVKFIQNTRFIIALLGCFLASQGVMAKEKPKKKPNLLFIMTDQQRYDALSIAGNSVLETPNIDGLAQQGTWFKNAYTPCAVCGPARSSILTGCTVETTGMNRNDLAYDVVKEGLMEVPTFDEILTEKGYRCEYYGKWHSQSSHADVYKNPQRKAENGMSIFGAGGQAYMLHDYIAANTTNQYVKAGELLDGLTLFPYIPDPIDKYHGMTFAEKLDAVKASGKGSPQCDSHGALQLPKELSITASQAKQTIEAIERLKDTTFSITCSFHFPHAPMLPTEPYYSMYPAKDMVPPVSLSDDMLNSPYRKSNGRLANTEYTDPEKIKYMISNYYGLVKEIDDWVGKILAKLDEHGLAENTLVIFTSDHGEMLGAHGLREKNVFYEESAHIPLMISYPGEIEKQTQVDGYVSLVDLYATIMDYLEVGKQKSDGKSLRGLIEGTDTKHGEYVVTEWDYRGDVSPNYMIVKDGWKLMIPYSKSSKVINAMYDLNSDPYEMNNLLGNNPNRAQYQEKAEELRKYLLQWLKKKKSKHYEGVKERELI